ncbi:heparinase II/III domain-containing protein [Aeromicrobium sp.]|uniref:heparinase II/III domain-containing protein n=1 Tax=Aeromicrobium sp. TaxID=1871063 RepID=UPI003C59E9DB
MRRLFLVLMATVAALAVVVPAAQADETAPAPTTNDTTNTSPGPDAPPAADPLDTSESQAPMSTFTTPGRTEEQCMGPKFTSTSSDSAVANRLMEGYVAIPTFREWKLPVDNAHHAAEDFANLTWRENPFANNNWVFNFQTLRWVDVLRRVGLATDNAEMLQRYEDIVHDWIRNNPYNRPRSVYSWYDMSVGVRSIGLVCATTAIDENDPANAWLKDALASHATSLMDEKQYRVVGNHALHQNMGLLALACHDEIPQATMQDTAVKRSNTLLERSVDTQGVSDEGSMLYQDLNRRWYLELKTRLELCGVGIDPIFGRVDKMADILAQATQPDGNLVAFGDTSARTKASSLPGTVAEYATTGGVCSIPLDGTSDCRKPGTYSVYRSGGFAFSRTGWFDTQTASQQSLAAIRFGIGRKYRVHGQQDAGNLNYSALGRQILWQPGVYGGGGGAPRSYVVRNDSHNVVDIPATTYDDAATTYLSVANTSTNADLFSVRTTALRGAVWKRTVIHAKKANFLLVDDYVTQSKSRTVVQRWHLAADRKTSISKNRVATSGTGSNPVILWVGTTPRLSVVRGQTNPLLGWRSERVNSFIKTPTAQASIVGKAVRLTALVIPRPSNVSSRDVRVISTRLSGSSRRVDVKIGTKSFRLVYTSSTVSVREL